MDKRKKMMAVLLVVSMLMSLLPLLSAFPAAAGEEVLPGAGNNEQQQERDLPKPSISLDKSGPATANPGQTITYTFTVTNGNCPLAGVVLTDSMLGMTEQIALMGPNSQKTFSGTYTVPLLTVGPITNNATVTGNYLLQQVSSTDSVTTTVLPGLPKIGLVKTGPATVFAGDTIEYTFTVSNLSLTPLTNVSVTDTKLGGEILNLASLGGLKSQTFTGSYKLKPGEGLLGGVDNTATAVGTATNLLGQTTQVNASSSWHVDVVMPCPGISIEKSGTPDPVKAGGTITYTLLVKNTGNVPLSNVVVKDPKLGIEKNLGNLEAGGQRVVTGTYTTGMYQSVVFNKATVEGCYNGLKVFGCSECTISVSKPKPGIQIIKDGPESACVGEEVTYNFTVTNTGDINLCDVVVSDPKLDMTKCLGSLATGESESFSATYTVKPLDGLLVVNTAVASAGSIYGPVSDTACHKMIVKRPNIKLEKCGPVTACVGETITYKFTVLNTGNVPLDNVTVKDPKLELTQELGTLCPGVPACFTADYVVQASDACELVNLAVVTGDSCCGQVKDRACHKVLVKNPAIEITKTGPETACVGDKITYKITVKNTGNMPLFSVKVEDPTLDWCETLCPLVPLCPGDSISYKVDYVVDEDTPDPMVNTATVTACSICCGQVMAEDDHTVDILNPKVEIDKKGPASGLRGETVTYEFTVKNAGDTELKDLKVTDTIMNDIGTIDTLAAGESKTLTRDYTIETGDPDPLLNTATVTTVFKCGGRSCGDRTCLPNNGPCPDDPPNTEITLTASDSHELDILTPAVKIEKTADKTSASVDDEVTYEFKVTNTGETDLENLEVTDPTLSYAGTITSLAKGESTTLTTTYKIKTGDPDPLVNTATVTGETKYGEKVTASDDCEVDITNKFVFKTGGIEIVKTVNDSDGIVKTGDNVSYTIEVTNNGATIIPKDIQLTDSYDKEYLSYQSASPASDDNIDDGEITWADISEGKGLEPGKSLSVTVNFVARNTGDTQNNAAVAATDEAGNKLEANDGAPVTIQARTLTTPVPTPVTATVTPAAPTQAATTASLPYTGDDLGILILIGMLMMPAGPLFMLADRLGRRKKGKHRHVKNKK